MFGVFGRQVHFYQEKLGAGHPVRSACYMPGAMSTCLASCSILLFWVYRLYCLSVAIRFIGV